MFGFARPCAELQAPVGAAPHTGEHGVWIRREEAIMGTAIAVELWCEQPSEGKAALAAVMDEMHRINRAMSPHKPESELSRINREAAAGPVALSAEMLNLLAQAERYSQITDGAFDISYAAVGRLFDFRLQQRPSEAALQQARAAIGYRHVLLDHQAGTVRFTHPGTCIDLGGFAKGHAVDQAAAILRRLGIRHAHISAGGDSRVMGDRRGRPWSIGIRDPRRPGALVAVLPLQDTSVSTSGDYERAFVEGGVRYHHLIDPASGRSPDAVCSVTVLGEDGLTTEALSKAVFVGGVERGMRLIDALGGVDAIVVDAAGRLHYSRGLQAPGPVPLLRPPAH
jgi:thiamine biosynthesis lipoprotein